MSNSDKIPKIGQKILVHNPNTISKDWYNVKSGDIAKVVYVISEYSIIAYNPQWKNDEWIISFGNWFGVVMWAEEYKVVEQ